MPDQLPNTISASHAIFCGCNDTESLRAARMSVPFHTSVPCTFTDVLECPSCGATYQVSTTVALTSTNAA